MAPKKKGKVKKTTLVARCLSPPTNPESSQAIQPRESAWASWTVNNETHLIDFLQNHQVEAGDRLNFKIVTWHAATTEMLKHQMKGAVKTLLTCKNKFSIVSYFSSQSDNVSTYWHILLAERNLPHHWCHQKTVWIHLEWLKWCECQHQCPACLASLCTGE
jgi:hypothetical protein